MALFIILILIFLIKSQMHRFLLDFKIFGIKIIIWVLTTVRIFYFCIERGLTPQKIQNPPEKTTKNPKLDHFGHF